jgi:hypothetical protein
MLSMKACPAMTLLAPTSAHVDDTDIKMLRWPNHTSTQQRLGASCADHSREAPPFISPRIGRSRAFSGQQIVEYSRVGGYSVGGHFGRCRTVLQRLVKNRPVAAKSRFVDTSTPMTRTPARATTHRPILTDLALRRGNSPFRRCHVAKQSGPKPLVLLSVFVWREPF